MSGPYQRPDLSNCGAGRLCVAINCGVLSVSTVSTLQTKSIVGYLGIRAVTSHSGTNHLKNIGQYKELITFYEHPLLVVYIKTIWKSCNIKL